MNPYKQTLYVVWGNILLFTSSVIWIGEWYLAPISIIALYTFGMFSEISVHRFYTHKSFKTSVYKEYLLRLFAFLTGQGATISWVTVHRYHHAYEDTINDPHSPLHHPKWKIFLGLFPNNYKKNLIIDLMRSKAWKYFLFENKYYWIMWTGLWLVTFHIHHLLFFFIVAGSALWYIATAIVNITAHSGKFGEHRFTDAVARNVPWLNVLSLAGNHNNHHKFPGSYTYKIDKEVDVYSWIIDKFFKA